MLLLERYPRRTVLKINDTAFFKAGAAQQVQHRLVFSVSIYAYVHVKAGAEVHYRGKDAAAAVRAGYPVNGKVRSVIEPAGTFYVRISGIRIRKQREYAADLSAAAQYLVPAGFKIRVYQRLGRRCIAPLVRIAALRHPSASGSVALHYSVLIGLFGVSDGV